MYASYDPTASYRVDESDVEYLRDGEEILLARIYRPDGQGPFPAVLYVHGGAWSANDRTHRATDNRRLAASGLLIVSVDFRLAPTYTYPAQVADVNYATRWVKAHAAEFNGDASRLGGIGSSSGGNTVLLSALRPRDPRYAARPLPESPDTDARLHYVIGQWPVLDPFVRFHFAKTTPSAGEGFGGAEAKMRETLGYFQTAKAMHDGNPQEVLERGEATALPDVLVLQGTDDMNIPLTLPQRFAPAYRAVGGRIAVEWFPGQPHGFMNHPGPATERAHQLMREFISSCLGALTPI